MGCMWRPRLAPGADHMCPTEGSCGTPTLPSTPVKQSQIPRPSETYTRDVAVSSAERALGKGQCKGEHVDSGHALLSSDLPG